MKRWGWNVGELGMLVGKWTRWIDVAKRNQTPWEAPGSESERADADTTNSGGERSAHEDDPGFFGIRDDGTARNTISVRRKRRGNDGNGVTQERRYDSPYNTRQRSQLHERQSAGR